MASSKPSFINSKGQRNRDTGTETDDLIERYVKAWCGRFVWEGLPEGCPADFLERQLFFYGGVSAKKIRGLGVCIMGAAPSTLSLYNTPLSWLPIGIYGSETTTSISRDIWKESRNPVLWDEMPMAERIAPYLEIQRKALNALSVNLIGLTNPVVIETAPGAELKGKIIKNNLGAGDVYLPVIDKASIGASVLDLKATDHTQNLTSVIHDTDNTMMDMMHIRASMEKTSGISTEEATASVQQISQGLLLELRKREEWADNINAKLGTSFKVSLPDVAMDVIGVIDDASDGQGQPDNTTDTDADNTIAG